MIRAFTPSPNATRTVRAAVSWLLIALTAYQSGVAAMGSFAIVVDPDGRIQVLCTYQGLRAAPGSANPSGEDEERHAGNLLCPAVLLGANHGDALPAPGVEVEVAFGVDDVRRVAASCWTPGAPRCAAPIRAPPHALTARWVARESISAGVELAALRLPV